MAGPFAVPSSPELKGWASSFLLEDLGDEFVGSMQRQLRRRVRVFTVSGLTPSVIGLLLAFGLQTALMSTPDTVFWTVSGTLAVAVVISTTQWRTIFCWFRPDVALTYYACACLDRLGRLPLDERRRSDVSREALSEHISYISGRLCDLEDALLSPRLTSQSCGTAVARQQVRRVQTALAVAIGTAEERWRTSPVR